jgi:hypothetical protein
MDPASFMSWILDQNRAIAIGMVLPLIACFLALSVIEKVLFEPAFAFNCLLVGGATTFAALLTLGKTAPDTWKAKFKCGLTKL